MLHLRLFAERRIVPIVVAKILIALVLDQLLGEPKRGHPLVAFGRWASALETRLNGTRASTGIHSFGPRIRGLIAWMLAVLPFVALVVWLSGTGWGFVFDVIVLYVAIGRKSLFEHGMRVFRALYHEDLSEARHHTAMIVSRECNQLDTSGCARATTESILENGSDSIFSALFWFAMLGAPGVVLYRLANTLDAMWGYRNERFAEFGYASAKIDDALNLVPARLCALSYALAGHTTQALRSWRLFARQLSSPNGGPVMSAGAGALNVTLGGPAVYHGEIQNKVFFGGSEECRPDHIPAANRLVDRALVIFLLGALLTELTFAGMTSEVFS